MKFFYIRFGENSSRYKFFHSLISTKTPSVIRLSTSIKGTKSVSLVQKETVEVGNQISNTTGLATGQ